MRYAALLFIINFISGLLLAQPPPIKAVKKWHSIDGGFKVALPGQPKIEVSEAPSSFGKTKFTTISLSTAFAYYSVIYFDFPTEMNDQYDLDIRFDAMRDATVKNMSARIIEDTKLSFGSYYGRANIFENSTSTATFRTFVVGPRLFQLYVVTRGRNSTLNDRLASANRERVSTFFNSFEITQVPEARSKPVPLPYDFEVKATSARFSSGFFGVSLMPPPNWVLAESSEADLLMELGKESIKSKDRELAERMTNDNMRVLAMYTNAKLEASVPDAFMFIMAERAPYPDFLAEAVAKTYLKLYLDPTEKVIRDATTLNVKGKPFSWIETYDSASKLSKRAYFSNIGGISFEIMFLYRKPADLNALLASLNSLTFTDRVQKQ